MWSVIGTLVARLAAIRWLIKILGGLGLLVPLAFVLKFIGLPVLMVLAVVAAPVLFVLFLFGLPIFLVFIVGGAMLAVLFSVLSVGLVALKVAVLVVLPVWLLWRLTRWLWRDKGSNGAAPNGGASS